MSETIERIEHRMRIARRVLVGALVVMAVSGTTAVVLAALWALGVAR